jgi:flavocytochrome c
MSEFEKKKGISRRGFMKSAAIGAGAITLAAFPTSKVEAIPLPKKWDQTVDVLVMGAGGAGMMAAIQAHDTEAKVLVLHKTSTVYSSSTALSGGLFAAAGTRFQKEKGIQDTPAQYYEDVVKNGTYMNDPVLVKLLTENSVKVFEWLVDNGLPPFRLEHYAGHNILRGHRSNKNSGRDLVDTAFGQIKKRKIPVTFETAGDALYVDPKSGRVLGVRAMKGKKAINIKARKAVVIASGGFTRDTKTFDAWVPAFSKVGTLTGDSANAGDGIKMAAKYAGSFLTHINYTATYPYGLEVEPRNGPVCRYWYFTPIGGILVNKEGKRYINEDIPPTKLTTTLTTQTDKVHYLVAPKGVWDEVFEKYPKGGVISPSTPESLEAEFKSGKVLFRADTIRDLAVKAGINSDNFEKTVAAYNGYVDAGKDPEFGRDGKFLKRKIEGPPYYAVKMTFATVLTLGGVKVNDKCQVMDPYDAAIPGLYAAGEAVGGVHGAIYLGGCALAWAYASGYIAGKNAGMEKSAG